MKIDHTILNYLRGKLNVVVEELSGFHWTTMPADELYHALMPDEATYHTMLAASKLASRSNIGSTIRMAVGQDDDHTPLAEFTVHFPYGDTWLLPEYLAAITPESTLGKRLFPSIAIVQDLASLSYVFTQITTYIPYSNVLPNIFPWVRDMVKDIKEREDNWKLARILGMGSYNTTTMNRIRSHLAALDIGKGDHPHPSLTKEIDRVCRHGSLAITQHTMVKGAKPPVVLPGYASIMPHSTAPTEEVRKQMQLVMEYYTNRKQDW